MKERPILFSGSMVRAILEGRKTQTRRIIKPQPTPCKVCHPMERDIAKRDRLDAEQGWEYAHDNKLYHCAESTFKEVYTDFSPYGQQGDRLWVRETWAKDIPGCPNGVTYRADHLDPLGDGPAKPITWKPSIHMPRIASRITLEITRVRVEQLRSITEADAKAEGVDIDVQKAGGRVGDGYYCARFPMIWDFINAKRGAWTSNPWVWVVEFKRVAPC